MVAPDETAIELPQVLQEGRHFSCEHGCNETTMERQVHFQSCD